jgi:tetratricopeptide (TPR) repeat protein
MPQSKKPSLSLPLEALLRDPTSEEEWRRTIAAWSGFIQRHLTSEHAELREMAMMTLIKRAAAYLHVRENDHALADIEQVLALHANASVTAKAYEVRATLHTSNHQDLSALEDWTQAIALCQSMSKGVVPPQEQAELALERGKCFARLKRYRDALADFALALEMDTACAEALCWQGLTFAYLNEEEQAIASCTRALECQPNTALFWQVRGVAYRLLNRFEQAFEDLEQATTLDPTHPGIEGDKRHTILKALLLFDHPSANAALTRYTSQHHQKQRKRPTNGAPEKTNGAAKKRKQTALRDQQPPNTFF